MNPEKNTTLYLHSNSTDVFDPSVAGSPAFTREGAEVPKDLVKQVQQKARENGLSLTQQPPA